MAEDNRSENNFLVPISSGEHSCLPGHFWGPGVRPYYLIHYVISGTGMFYCGNHEYVLKPGQIFVIFPGIVTKYQADAVDPWRYTWVIFRGEEMKDVLNALGITRDNPVHTLKNSAQFLEQLRSMPRARSPRMQDNLRFSACIYQLMALLAENQQSAASEENVYLTAAIEYINSHYFEEITVNQVADYVGISRKYLFAIFKEGLGISPKDYIMDQRISRARDFLKDSSLPISHIAYSVGYKDSMAFSKMFKVKTGLSPSQFREG